MRNGCGKLGVQGVRSPPEKIESAAVGTHAGDVPGASVLRRHTEERFLELIGGGAPTARVNNQWPWGDATRGALKQGRPDRDFQRLDASGQRRLRQVQRVRRLVKPAEVQNSEERPDVEQLEIDAHNTSITPIFAFLQT